MPSVERHPTSRIRDRHVDARVGSAVDRLEEDIILGVLHPRERLVEDDVCARFGLKRHVTRRVLAELELRGLVERRKHSGALVRSYTAQEVVDLYAVREILETNAARLIGMPVAKKKLSALAKAQARHDAAAARSDFRGVFRANIEFHHALFALSENKVLQETIKDYQRKTLPIRFSSNVAPRYLEKVTAEHHRMIEALRKGDRRRLVRLCRDHLFPARNAYLEAHHR